MDCINNLDQYIQNLMSSSRDAKISVRTWLTKYWVTSCTFEAWLGAWLISVGLLWFSPLIAMLDCVLGHARWMGTHEPVLFYLESSQISSGCWCLVDAGICVFYHFEEPGQFLRSDNLWLLLAFMNLWIELLCIFVYMRSYLMISYKLLGARFCKHWW